MNYFIIDTETTGLPDYKTGTWPKLVSIALIHGSIVNDELEIYYENEWFINDWVDEFKLETQQFLNLSKDYIIEHGQSFDNVKTYILNYISQYELKTFVAHNSTFDMNVLKNCGLDLSMYNWYCTMIQGLLYIMKNVNFKYTKYPKLSELAKHFNISIENNKLHASLYDAQICANIFYSIYTKSYDTKLQNIKTLSLRNRDINIIF